MLIYISKNEQINQ